MVPAERVAAREFCGPPVYCDAGMATVSAMPPKEDLGRPNGHVGEREAHAVLEDVRELDRAVEGHGAGEGDAELLDHHAEEGHHGDAAVLDLDGAAAGEASVSSNMKPGVIGPGSTPMSPLTTTLEAACWPRATKAAAGRRRASELAI